MERKGIATDRGNINREVADINKEIRQAKARIKKVKTWLYAQPVQDAPTFLSVLNNIADAANLNTHWQRIGNLKLRARVLVFLQNNKISDMEHLVAKVTAMNEELQSVSGEIKKVDRRLETLSRHLSQVEARKKHKAVYDKYQKLTVKKGDAFYDKHFEAIQAYEAANKYIKDVLNSRTKIPVGEWKQEQEKLNALRYSLAEKFYGL